MSIPIFLASDENYAPYLCTTMFSILMHTTSQIDFYVMSNKISDDSKAKIKESLSCYNNFSIEYIDISNFDLSRFPNKRHYSLNAFARYFIPDIKPELKKVLYLDSDIIVRDDILKLWNYDLNGKSIAAVSEKFNRVNGIYLKENIDSNYSNIENYFNTGVLVLDVEGIKKESLMQQCIEKTIELSDKLSCPDQDVLNIVFEDKVQYLPDEFNFMPDLLEASYFPFYGEVYSNKIKDNAKIIHYVAGKPWFNLSCVSDYFWEVAKKTKFYESIKNKPDEPEKKRIFELDEEIKGLKKVFYKRIKQRSFKKKRHVYILFWSFVIKTPWKYIKS